MIRNLAAGMFILSLTSCTLTSRTPLPPLSKHGVEIARLETKKTTTIAVVHKSADYKRYLPLTDIDTRIHGKDIVLQFNDDNFCVFVQSILDKEFSVQRVKSQFYQLPMKTTQSDSSTRHKTTLEIELLAEDSDLVSVLGETYLGDAALSFRIYSSESDDVIWECDVPLEQVTSVVGVKVLASTGVVSTALDKVFQKMTDDGVFAERKMIQIFQN